MHSIEEFINENGHTVPRLLLSNGELNPNELGKTAYNKFQ